MEEEAVPQLSWLDFLEHGQNNEATVGKQDGEELQDDEGDVIERLRKRHKAAVAWPFPFESAILEKQYLDFSAPAVLIPPMWSLLFLLYLVNAPPPDFSETGEWCPLDRTAVQGIQWSLFSITLVIMLLQCTKLWMEWRGNGNLENPVLEDGNSQSPTSDTGAIGESLGVHHTNQDSRVRLSLFELPNKPLEQARPAEQRSSLLLTSRPSQSSESILQSLRVQDQVGSLYLFFRTVVLYSILVEAVVRAVQLWRCWAPTKVHDVDIMSSSLMHFSGTLILHGSLKWDIPRFLSLPLANTILSSYSSAQAVEDRFAQVIALWIITFIFLCIAWDAERESRSRFLLSKALEVMRQRSDQQKRKVAQTLRSICDEDQLQMYLTGVPLRDESPCCYILILSIHDCVLWRQQNTVAVAMRCIDLLQREIERQRHQYPDLSHIIVSGDETIVSLGLRACTSPSPNAAPQTTGDLDQGRADSTRIASHSSDASDLVLFAFQSLSTPRMLATRAQITTKAAVASSLREEVAQMTRLRSLLSSLALRAGIGYGPCEGALVPGRGAHYILKGIAFDAAQTSLVRSIPGTLDLPLPVVQCSHSVTVMYRRLPEPEGSPRGKSADPSYVRVTNVRRRPHESASPVGVLDPAEASGAEDIIVGDSLSPTAARSNRCRTNSRANSSTHQVPHFLRQPAPLKSEENDLVGEPRELSPAAPPLQIEEARMEGNTAPDDPTLFLPNHTLSGEKSSEGGHTAGAEKSLKPPFPSPTLSQSRLEQTICDTWNHAKAMFHPIQEATYYRFVDRRLLRRGHFINACWFAMSFVFHAPLFNEVFGNVKSVWILVAIECSRIALWAETILYSRKRGAGGSSPDPPPFFRWQIFFFGICQFALLIAAAVVVDDQVTLSFAQNFPSLHCNLLFSMTSIDGIPLLLSLATTIGFQAVTAGLRTQVGVGARLLSLLPPIILPIIKASLIQSEYQQLVNLADRKVIAEHDRQAHERALNMVIPSYIASHIAKLEARGGGKVVSDALLDVAMLVLRFPPVASLDVVLDTLTDVQRYIEQYPEISLISTDGDVMMISGPLARPAPTPLTPQFSTNRFFHLQTDRFVAEGVANRASQGALRVLRYLQDRFRHGGGITAVLHRGDGVAVVFQRKRPVFAVEGVVAEVSKSVLQHLPNGVVCVTHRFAELYPNSLLTRSHCSGLRRDSGALVSPTASPLLTDHLDISTNHSVCLRIKGVGFINVYYQ